MNMKQVGLSLAGALALAACSSMPSEPATAAEAATDGAAMVFDCQNGLQVRKQQLGSDTIRLTVDGKSAVMKQAVAASGVRYVADSGLFGGGGQWHEKGGEAVFSYAKVHGGEAETFCSQQ